MNSKDIFKKAKEFFAKFKWAVLIAIIGVALIIFPNTAEDKKATYQQTSDIVNEQFSIEGFEQQLANILAECQGVGRVKVMLTQKTGMETIYEHNISRNSKNQSDDDDSLYLQSEETRDLSLIQNSSYGENPVIVKQKYPELLGAVIVCDGGGSDRVKLEIIQAVKALTGISTDNISIIKMKSN